MWYGLLLVCVAFKVAWVVFTLPLVVLTLPSPKVMGIRSWCWFFFSDQVGGRNSNEALVSDARMRVEPTRVSKSVATFAPDDVVVAPCAR